MQNSVTAVTIAVSLGLPAHISANKTLYDPNTGKPMSFDTDKRQLHFDISGIITQGAPKRIAAGI